MEPRHTVPEPLSSEADDYLRGSGFRLVDLHVSIESGLCAQTAGVTGFASVYQSHHFSSLRRMFLNCTFIGGPGCI
jgi:hypothetical protein